MCGGLGKPVRRQRGSIRTKKVKSFSQNWIFLNFKKPKKNNVGMLFTFYSYLGKYHVVKGARLTNVVYLKVSKKLASWSWFPHTVNVRLWSSCLFAMAPINALNALSGWNLKMCSFLRGNQILKRSAFTSC